MAGTLNKVMLIGRVGADPEIRTFGSGGKVANLRLATSESWRDKASGERKERTEWHSVAIFNEGLVKIAEQYVRKGALVYIEGQLETRKWQDQAGNDRSGTEVTVRPYRGDLHLLGDARREGDREERGDRGGYGGGDDHAGQAPASSRESSHGGRYGSGGGMDDEIPF